MFEYVMFLLESVREWFSFGPFGTDRIPNRSIFRGNLFRFIWLRDRFPFRNPNCFFRPYQRVYFEHLAWIRKRGRVAGFRQKVINPANGYFLEEDGLNFVPISCISPMFSFNFSRYVPSKNERR